MLQQSRIGEKIWVTPVWLTALARRSNTTRVGLTRLVKTIARIGKQIGLAGLAKAAAQIDGQFGLVGLATL
jgi:hypothetical protein